MKYIILTAVNVLPTLIDHSVHIIRHSNRENKYINKFIKGENVSLEILKNAIP